MNFDLNFEGFEQYLIATEIIPEKRVQYVFIFDNGYGASVIKDHRGSYGAINDLWELAVIQDARHSHDDDILGHLEYPQWYLVCDTPITDDVIGYLTDKEVREIMKQIQALPEEEKE